MFIFRTSTLLLHGKTNMQTHSSVCRTIASLIDPNPWTEKTGKDIKGNLEPLFRVPRSTVGPLQSDGLAESDSTAKNNSNQPRIMRDLKRALCWIHSHTELFAGKVTEPAVMKMSAEDQQNALEALSELENGCEESRDPFTFTFELQEDMETFLCNCADLMGLKVNAMFL
ncbi:uncharacterized protein LOC143515211 [Brachyhypopomus gauderio]|uniref:uncharacterized protein LOC143515211 n=1 Tax=Brachyhypopomus gauderio TaxID=698409 RepID=UPI004042F3E0